MVVFRLTRKVPVPVRSMAVAMRVLLPMPMLVRTSIRMFRSMRVYLPMFMLMLTLMSMLMLTRMRAMLVGVAMIAERKVVRRRSAYFLSSGRHKFFG